MPRPGLPRAFRPAILPRMDTTLAKLKKAIDAKRDLAIALQRDLTAIPALGPENDGTGEKDKAHKLVEWLPRLGLPEPKGYPVARPPRARRQAAQPRRDDPREGEGLARSGSCPTSTSCRRASAGSGRPTRTRLVVDGDRIIGPGRGGQPAGPGRLGDRRGVPARARPRPARTVRLLFVADEETGSEHGVQHVLTAAPRAFHRRRTPRWYPTTAHPTARRSRSPRRHPLAEVHHEGKAVPRLHAPEGRERFRRGLAAGGPPRRAAPRLSRGRTRCSIPRFPRSPPRRRKRTCPT